MNASQLQGKELLQRRWNATLELTLTDNRTGRKLTRAVTLDDVWEDREFFKQRADSLEGLMQDALPVHVVPGVGLKEIQ